MNTIEKGWGGGQAKWETLEMDPYPPPGPTLVEGCSSKIFPQLFLGMGFAGR